MPTDLDDLLAGSTREPGAPLDVDALWSAGRRRRRVRQVTAAGGGLAGIAVVAVVVGAIGLNGPATPEVSPLEAPEPTEEAEPTEDVDGPDESEAEEPGQNPVAEDSTERMDPAPAPDDVDDEPEAEVEAPETEPEVAPQTQQEEEPARESTPEPGTGPTPDPNRLAAPCAAHDPDAMVSFLDVVGPVAGQRVGASVELVGCGRVPEGTVRYRVLQGGQVLVDSFTTATYGGPELGEFRQTLPLGATGELEIQVFWESMADGSEQDRTTITVSAS